MLVVSAELCGVTWIIGQRHLTAGNMQVLRVAVGVVQGYGGVDAIAIGAGIFGIGETRSDVKLKFSLSAVEQ